MLRCTTLVDMGAFATGLGIPEGLAFDSAGNLYVANFGGSIVKITPGGTQSVFANSGLTNPVGLAFDSTGNLFAANYGPAGNGTIRRFSSTGTDLGVFASGFDNPTYLAMSPVPEPATWALTGLSMFGLGVLRRRIHRRRQSVRNEPDPKSRGVAC